MMMMMIRRDYYSEIDIDWFGIANDCDDNER